MTVQARVNSPKRSTPSPRIMSGIEKIATSMGAPAPAMFHAVLTPMLALLARPPTSTWEAFWGKGGFGGRCILINWFREPIGKIQRSRAASGSAVQHAQESIDAIFARRFQITVNI